MTNAAPSTCLSNGSDCFVRLLYFFILLSLTFQRHGLCKSHSICYFALLVTQASFPNKSNINHLSDNFTELLASIGNWQ